VPQYWTLFVIAPLIIWKEVSYKIVSRKATETNSTVLKAEAWHHRSDAISSIAAFVGISIALYFGKGFEVADDWAALIAAALIYYNSFLIFRPALAEVMDEHLYDDLVTDIRNIATQVPGILSTEKCMVRKAGMQYHIDLHAEVDGTISVTKGHHLAHLLKDKIIEQLPQVADVLVHIEPQHNTIIS
jgi:cation diffusion facilitator family transporter